MKSGLEGRNNWRGQPGALFGDLFVSMKSGLEGRNNVKTDSIKVAKPSVSMKSGLEGRNNMDCLRRHNLTLPVSMKSGLEGRNNSRHGPNRRRRRNMSQ